MAKPLKTAGAQELEAFRRRVMRQRAMDRIGARDSVEIIAHLDEIQRIITEMWEEGEEDYS